MADSRKETLRPGHHFVCRDYMSVLDPSKPEKKSKYQPVFVAHAQLSIQTMLSLQVLDAFEKKRTYEQVPAHESSPQPITGVLFSQTSAFLEHHILTRLVEHLATSLQTPQSYAGGLSAVSIFGHRKIEGS